jgi:hypothetical protein
MPKSGPYKETPVRAHLLERLRSAITEGMFQPGDHLVERELCERLGVSRTSLREALRQIEAEGPDRILPQPRRRGARDQRGRGAGAVGAALHRRKPDRPPLRHPRHRGGHRPAGSFHRQAWTRRSRRRTARPSSMPSSSCGKASRQAATTPVPSSSLQINARLSFLWSSSLLLPGRPAESIAEFASLLSAIRSRNPAWPRPRSCCTTNMPSSSRCAAWPRSRRRARRAHAQDAPVPRCASGAKEARPAASQARQGRCAAKRAQRGAGEARTRGEARSRSQAAACAASLAA